MYSGLYNRGTKVDNIGPGMPQIDKRWTWISLIDRLSGGDITKHQEIYERNWIECLNLLSFWNERDRYQEQIDKMNKLKNRR